MTDETFEKILRKIKLPLGKLLSDKLNGLKKFITEFSVINERQIEKITIWDYYMIYAIVFDLKGKLDREVKTLYNIFIGNN